MKISFRNALALILCMLLCLILAPVSFAEGDVSVRFYSEKGYDLAGLRVTDAEGNEIIPAETGDGCSYLLTSGTYTYAYHDDREIFTDIEETAFTVESDTLEIPVSLKASFADDVSFDCESNPALIGLVKDITSAEREQKRQEMLDWMIRERIARSEGEQPFFASDAETFDSNEASLDEVSAALKSAMLQRQEETGEVVFYTDTALSMDLIRQIIKNACTHTGDQREGDTLRYGYSRCGYSAYPDQYDATSQLYRHDMFISLGYNTTLEQEQAASAAVASLVDGMNLSGKSDYEKAFAINQWLMTNVNYDYTHLNDQTYTLKYSDYAALHDRSAVCQGFSLAFYRLALEAGLDARFIMSSTMNHAWNIVRINGKYYSLDSTWDSNLREGGTQLGQLPHFFARGSEWWLQNHKLDSLDYSTIGDQFDSGTENYDPMFDSYKLAASDYDPSASISGTWGNLSWALDNSGSLTISGSSTMNDFTFDSADAWKAYKDNIKSVTILSGVTRIGDNAFEDCVNLEHVSIPASVTSIGSSAFSNCKKLDNLSIPGSVTEIEMYAFSRCERLTSVVIPSAVKALETSVFSGCTALANVTLSEGLERIEDGAFSLCSALKSITIPASVTSIDGNALSWCQNLTDVFVDADNNSYRDLNGVLFNKSRSRIICFPAGRTGTYTIPSYVTSIGNHAFCYSSLESVTIPRSVVSIGDGAFMNSSMTSLAIPDSVTEIGRSVFTWSALTDVSIPTSVTSISSEAFLGCNKLSTLEIPESVTRIDREAFAFSSLVNISIPRSVTSLGDSIFAYCDVLEDVEILADVTQIPDSTFKWCSALKSVSIPACVTSVGEEAFSNCKKLTDVYFGGTQAQWDAITVGSGNETLSAAAIHTAGASGTWGDLSWTLDADGLLTISGSGEMPSFPSSPTETWRSNSTEAWRAYKDQITSVVVNRGVTSLGMYAFEGCVNMQRVLLADGVTSIGYCAFYDCPGMTSLTVPASVTNISNWVFYPCTGLKSAGPIGGGYDYEFGWTEQIPDYAFMACGGLTSVTIPESVTSIGKVAFSGCDALTGVTIPASVVSIGDSAFTGCSRLTSIEVKAGNRAYCDLDGVLFTRDQKKLCTFPAGRGGDYSVPEGVTTIGKAAFQDSRDLEHLTLPSSVTGIEEYAFAYCSGLTEMTIPSNVTVISYSLFNGCSSLTRITIPAGVTQIQERAFTNCKALTDVYFGGTQAQWDAITVGPYNEALSSAVIHTEEAYSVHNSPYVRLSGAEKAVYITGSLSHGDTLVYTASPDYVNTITLRTSDYQVSDQRITLSVSFLDGLQPGEYTLFVNHGISAPTRIGTMTIEQEEVHENGFNVSQDAYSFGNSMGAYGYTGRGPGASYPIKYEPSFTLIFGDTVAGKSKYKQAIMGRWSGNCCGMSSTTALMKFGQMSAGDFGKSNVNALSIADSNGSMSVLTFVEAMQVAQYTDQFARDYKGNRVFNYELAAGSTKLTALYHAVNSDLAQGRGTIIGVCRSGVGAHALLAYRMETVSSTEKRMYVYDCNFPGEARYFVLQCDNAGELVSWTYDMGGYGTWGVESGDFISYIPYSTIEYIWNHRGDLYEDSELLSFSGENLSIADFAGREVAAIVDGQLQTSRSDIYELPELSMTWNATKSVFLPRDFYTVTSNDGTPLELSMADRNTGANVTTSAASVSFAVDDRSRENTVIVENATPSDTYSVSLESTLAGVKYENVVVSGTGRGESISISGDNDTLSLSNCNVSSLQINGVERVTYTITAYSGPGGSISPKGDVLVDVNGSVLFKITPDTGYVIDSVKVDGNDIGAASEYEFTNVIREHSITATFRQAYGVTEAFFDRGSNTVTADLVNQASIKLVCAAYDSEGRMLCMASKTASKNCGTVSLSLPGGALPNDITIKLFLLDSRWRPLCEKYSFSA